jgi:glycerophosphoryl diester phosphodiesterase
MPISANILGFAIATALLASAAAAGDEKIRLIAHRGGSMEADENTLAAFTDAYAKGLRAFETDVRMTKDGQLVLLHDDSADRTTSGHGPVEMMTAGQVKALHTKQTSTAVPFLKDLLAAFKERPGVFFQFEIKPGSGPIYDARLDKFSQALTELVTQALPREAYCYSSFDRRSLLAIKRADPACSTTLLVSQAPDVKLLPDLKTLGCDRVSVIPGKTTKSFVDAAKQAGVKVAGWSVRRDEDLAQAQALGLESVTTDCPRRMLADGLGRP